MGQRTTIELFKENMKFSVAHFTIFSATNREKLHGHNYTVHLAISTVVEENGLSFDYRFYKDKAYQLCQKLTQSVLLPTESAYLKLEEDGDYIYGHYNNEKIPFMKSDVTLMPLTNITVEELSQWFVNQLIADKDELSRHHIESIEVKVFSGPGQSGSAKWEG